MADDHKGSVTVDKTLEELELRPHSVPPSASWPERAVHHGHAPELPGLTGGDTPADLSSEIVTDLLRNKLGYSNVIITDSHQMASITDHYTSAEAAVAAIAAGCDMVLMPEDLQGGI